MEINHHDGYCTDSENVYTVSNRSCIVNFADLPAELANHKVGYVNLNHYDFNKVSYVRYMSLCKFDEDEDSEEFAWQNILPKLESHEYEGESCYCYSVVDDMDIHSYRIKILSIKILEN